MTRIQTRTFILSAALLLSFGLGACAPVSTDTATESAPASATAAPTEAATFSLGEQRSPAQATTGNVTVSANSVIVGNPDAAKRIQIYIDMQCPHCQTLHGVMADDKAGWAAGSDVAVEYTVVDYLGPRTTHGYSFRAANLLALIADKDPASWPAAMQALLDNQPPTTTDTVSDHDLFDTAVAAGANLSDADLAAMAELNYYEWVQSATSVAAAAGVNYIPQVWIDGAQVVGADHEETAKLVREAVG